VIFPSSVDPAELANMTDDEIVAAYAKDGVNEEDARAMVAVMRGRSGPKSGRIA
jgi:hypothetical protein